MRLVIFVGVVARAATRTIVQGALRIVILMSRWLSVNRPKFNIIVKFYQYFDLFYCLTCQHNRLKSDLFGNKIQQLFEEFGYHDFVFLLFLLKMNFIRKKKDEAGRFTKWKAESWRDTLQNLWKRTDSIY